MWSKEPTKGRRLDDGHLITGAASYFRPSLSFDGGGAHINLSDGNADGVNAALGGTAR